MQISQPINLILITTRISPFKDASMELDSWDILSRDKVTPQARGRHFELYPNWTRSIIS